MKRTQSVKPEPPSEIIIERWAPWHCWVFRNGHQLTPIIAHGYRGHYRKGQPIQCWPIPDSVDPMDVALFVKSKAAGAINVVVNL